MLRAEAGFGLCVFSVLHLMSGVCWFKNCVCVFDRYMVERRWYEQWKEFVETGDQNSSSFPGQIDNTELFEGQFSPLPIKQTLLLPLLLSLTPLVICSDF